MSSSRLSKQTRSKKARSSRALKLSLAAVAGATGGMGNDASAEIVTANLNSAATVGNDIYFSYSAGTIGTSISVGGIKGTVGNPKGSLSRGVISLLFDTSGLYGLNVSSPFAADALISSSTPTWLGGNAVQPSFSGYWGVRFSAGGSDYNYAWVDVTYTETGLTFGLASVETTINTGILAGAVAPTGVPEIDPASAGSAASLVAGVLAMVEQRRRRRVVLTGNAVA